MTTSLIEIIVGGVLILASLTYGLIRILAVPQGWGFSGKAVIRYILFTALALAGGIALITFGLIK